VDPCETRDRLLQGGDQTSIELNGEHAGAGRRERHREGPEPGADLDDVVGRPDLGVGRDRAGEVGVDQEVLAERSRGPDRVTSREVPDRPGAEPAGGDAP
jgi:hypothetical protein